MAGHALKKEDNVESLVAGLVDIASLLQHPRDLFCYETLSASQSQTFDSGETSLSTPNSEPGVTGDEKEKKGDLLAPLTSPSVLRNKNHWHAKRLSGVYSVKRTPKRRRKLFQEGGAKENAAPQAQAHSAKRKREG